MFYDGMRWADIKRRTDENKAFLARNYDRMLKEVKRIARTKRPLPLYFCRTVKNSDKDEYLFIFITYDGKNVDSVFFSVINTSKGKEYVLTSGEFEEDYTVDRVTAHFLRRFRERSLKEDRLNTEDVLAKYLLNNKTRMLLYQDPESPNIRVYATRQGISITDFDEDKGFIRMKTYIDDSMLYASQRIAKQNLMSQIPEDYKEEEYMYYIVIMDKLKPLTQEIYEVYKKDPSAYLQFQKENAEDKIKLNFTLKTKRPKLPTKETTDGHVNLLIHESSSDHCLLKDGFLRKFNNITYKLENEHGGKARLKVYMKGKLFFVYDGEVKDQFPYGYGIMRLKGEIQPGHTYEGNFKDGLPWGHCKHIYPDGSVDEGNYKEFYRHGMIHCVRGDSEFWSMFVDDEKVGNIKFVCPDFTYEGECDNYEFKGKAKVTFPSGYVIEGTINNFKLEGKGKEIYGTGTVVEANYVNGDAQGPGIMTEEDGRIYRGIFKNGYLDGIVEKQLPNGKVIKVVFEDGDEIEDYTD